MILTNLNYHSPEANRVFMSNSLYKVFLECEERAMAQLDGTWQEEQSDALLLGSYVHAALEGDEALEKFLQDNPDMFTKKGELYAKYEIADRMVETLKQDEFVDFILDGQKEVIITAEMFGCWWKVKIDSLHIGKRFADVKTCKAIREKVWHPRYGYCSFVEGYGYTRQIALYAEAERIASGRDKWLEPLIVAVSKEDPPDKEVIGIDTDRMQMELEDVEANMERILQVRNGLVEPKRCEKCKYCRQTKRVRHVVHYMDLLA